MGAKLICCNKVVEDPEEIIGGQSRNKYIQEEKSQTIRKESSSKQIKQIEEVLQRKSTIQQQIEKEYEQQQQQSLLKKRTATKEKIISLVITEKYDQENVTIRTKSHETQQTVQRKESNHKEFYVTPETFVTLKVTKIYEHYKIGAVLGEGAYGKVYLVEHKETKDIRAMKCIKKTIVSQSYEDKLFAEVSILKSIDHPNIVKVYEFFIDKKDYYLITEYCSGGELFDKIRSMRFFSEQLAAHYMRQILSAVVYCHEKNIVHRDLKPENLILDSKKSDSLLKVIDFGTSPYYIAPEVLAGKYNEKCDVWSCGVIMYILLCGYPPFGGSNNQDIFNKVNKGKFSFEDEDWDKVSLQAKTLITKMLTYDPKKRISAKDALGDIWIQKNAPSKQLSEKVLQNLSQFNSKNKLRQAILTFIATQITSQKEKEELQQTFQTLDKDGDGLVSQEELIKGYQLVYQHKEQAKIEAMKIIEQVDVNKSGKIDYTEFVVAAMNQEKFLSKQKIENAFKIFDQNGDGFITKGEVEQIFGGVNIDDDTWKEVIKECDLNKDGKISLSEFIELLSLKIDGNKVSLPFL